MLAVDAGYPRAREFRDQLAAAVSEVESQYTAFFGGTGNLICRAGWAKPPG